MTRLVLGFPDPPMPDEDQTGSPPGLTRCVLVQKCVECGKWVQRTWDEGLCDDCQAAAKQGRRFTEFQQVPR